MGIHSTQDKARVKVQTKDRTNHLDLEQMKMNKVLLTIHVLVGIVYPTVQDTLLDTTPNGERFNKHSHSAVQLGDT
jgi:hypothetical protein